MSDTHPELEAGAKPFLDHLEDLRTCLLRSFGALLVGMIIAGFFVPRTIEWLKAPMMRILQERPPTIIPAEDRPEAAFAGAVSLDKQGRAEVVLPAAATTHSNLVFSLTAVAAPDPGLHVAQGVVSNRFVIAGRPAGEVNWVALERTARAREIPFDADGFLMVPEAMGGIGLFVRVLFWSGLLLAFPFISFAIGAFIFPGLLEKEKKVLLGSSGIAVVLFAFGVALGYFICIEYAFRFIFTLEGWMGVPRDFMYVTSYINVVVRLLLAFGIAFELPLILYILGVLELVEVRTLRQYRRHVFVGILVMSMLLTPQDPFTMLVMAVPLYLLFELTLVLLQMRESGPKGAVAGR